MVELAVAAQANRRCNSEDRRDSDRDQPGVAAAAERPCGRTRQPGRLREAGRPRGVTRCCYADTSPPTAARSARPIATSRLAGDLEPPDADWRWEIECARAELSELRGGLFGDMLAEYHFRRAIAIVAELRSSARARSAYLVTSHRGPYDGLIALLARHGRWRDVLGVVLELDASDMLRATADEAIARDHTLRGATRRSGARPRRRRSPSNSVVAAWRSRELVIVIAPSPRQIGPGHERAYRLRIAGGQVTGEDVGDASTARRWADDLFADPGDRASARALGRMIVPPGRRRDASRARDRIARQGAAGRAARR